MLFNKRQNEYQIPNIDLSTILYELEQINRKLRNLNNRLKRIENFLNLNEEQ